jgi:DNA-binding NarL/FixJ family response regulator
MADAVSVLLVDDHPVVRFGLRIALERAEGFAVCGEAGDISSARESVARLKPCAIVLDLGLGGRDGVEFVSELTGIYPPARILVFSALPELTYARRVFRAGARGYLMKDEGAEKVPAALTVIARGERYASPAVQTALFQEVAGGGSPRLDPSDPVAALTARELQVLRLFASGLTLGDVARELNLSVKTIGAHRERLKNKLNAENARELERVAGELLRFGRI